MVVMGEWEMDQTECLLRSIGIVRSPLKHRKNAPRQGREGAPDAWLEINPTFADGLRGLAAGSEVIVMTWLHEAQRDTLLVYPRGDQSRPMMGVFATRSPDRPNPIGLHRVKIRDILGTKLRVGPLEAIDGTPILDFKPVLSEITDS
jgi:tRNA-Thr(GGU) m(6)t(6)A37 methyltransferase TsaA